MREFRLGKDDTAHYSSLEEMREALGSKVKQKSISKDELEKRRNNFVKTCRCCDQPLTYISGTNTLACKNPNCKGMKHTSKNSDGTEKVWFTPVTRILNEKGLRMAMSLFD